MGDYCHQGVRARGSMRRGTVISASLVLMVLAGCGADAPALPAGELAGSVRDADGNPLAGVMVTAHDATDHLATTVFTDEAGQYAFPALEPRAHEVWTRRIGYAGGGPEPVDLSVAGARLDFALEDQPDFADQLPAHHFNNRVADRWPDSRMRDDFTLTCAGCHQVGNHYYQGIRTREGWLAIVERMMTEQQAPGLTVVGHEEVAEVMSAVFGHDAHPLDLERPGPPAGAATDVVIREYLIDPQGRADDCHDAFVASDGIVYTERGFMLDPRTAERDYFPVRERGHSLDEAEDGSLWITITRNDPDVIGRLDPATGELSHFVQHEVDGERGVYPHTIRFDQAGVLWYSLSASNHVARFDPETESLTYYPLPEGSEGDLPLLEHPEFGAAVAAYGLDVAPDGGVWWGQLLGQRIGRIDPETGEMRHWTTPLAGPRRIRAGPDGMIWVPFFGPAKVGRFDPEAEEWTLWDMPTGPGELPYALAVNHDTGHVWITGSNSDSLIRFEPETERFTVFPLPTPNSFTRDIVFDPDGHVWSCSSARAGYHPEDRLGQPRVFQIELTDG